ncbi:rano class II histocompatibility antigen, A beta chain-like [Acanthochromis polyacanthus]|uniref:rano class II histocompatibility antigen, A beta chain-like n=1 Tax=Acanthochromis polyacanthus TaxID=80966 RepID=UPI00223439AD|nr:rano class II histocompatibility antigen, A beta chain-like [Acanthochromis polyacanthus]
MHINSFLFCAVFSLFSPVFSAEDFYQSRGCCTFRGPNFEDTEFIIKFYFNENLMMEYNSTRGNWTGSTNYSFEIVKTWNSDPYAALTRALEKKTLCEGSLDYIRDLDALTSAPTIRLKAVKQPSMLVCSAYNFYPKQIKITWLQNGQEVTSGISSSLARPDGEFYYQIHSYLEFTPTHGENITCMVEHYSLSEPALVVWDPSLPVAQRIQIAVGLCGLMLGFAVLVCGLIYYKKKSAAYMTVCQGRVMIPVELIPPDGAS